jgi:hypothetical protein
VATASLTDEAGGRELDVLESHVDVEIENQNGQIATIRRYAKHASIDTQLVTVWDGPVLTEHLTGLGSRAYFVRRPGSAQREAGFHHWLAEFVGWELPEVVHYDGSTSPLYLETIFPLFFVEQKRGWAGLQAQTPTYLRIRDVGRRNVEFVLSLSGADVVAERQLLAEKIAVLRERWKATVGGFRAGANDRGIGVQGLPEEPVAEWPIEPGPSLFLAVAPEWRPLSEVIQGLQVELAKLTSRILPGADASAPLVSDALQKSLRELDEISGLADALHRELALEEDQIRSLDSRIASLHHDVRRSQDALVLRAMGAPVTAVTPPNCPTCHQELPSTLLDPASAITAMPLERNSQLLTEQIALFEAMRTDLVAAISAKRQQLPVLDERAHSLQQSVRAQRETLISAAGAPSIEDVEARVHLRDRVNVLEAVVVRLSRLDTELAGMAQTWGGLQQDRIRLREQTAPRSDQTKLAALETSFLAQLHEYGFTSVPISDLTISPDTYLPVYEGFDLGFDLSASDMVRTIWAHRVGLLEVAREFESRHAQLLVFDEPRQQSADPVSFAALFRRAAQAASSGQQVVFATSEPDESVRAMLAGVPHEYLSFEGKMIRALRE